MLEESNKMVEDSSERLGKAVGELRDLVVSAQTPLCTIEPLGLVPASILLSWFRSALHEK